MAAKLLADRLGRERLAAGSALDAVRPLPFWRFDKRAAGAAADAVSRGPRGHIERVDRELVRPVGVGPGELPLA
jgi:hypothetical protein